MARSDLLINLTKAAIAGDISSVEKTAETIIYEERQKQHHTLADRLYNIIKNTRKSLPVPGSNGNSYPYANSSTKSGDSKRDFLAAKNPRRSLNDLVLPADCLKSCQELIEEQHRADILRSHALEPRHRVLLTGPPGNGKTSLAEALAFELGVEFFSIRYETVIGSFLGETSTRLKQIFDYVRTIPCVLFFDEFDTLGKERGDTHETGEIKRVVSSLLLQIDELPSYTVTIAATNHPELLDRAVWRRFQLKMNLPRPDAKRLRLFLDILFKRFPGFNEALIIELCNKMKHMSFSEIEDFCLDLQRRLVLSLGTLSLSEIIESRLPDLKNRTKHANKNIASRFSEPEEN